MVFIVYCNSFRPRRRRRRVAFAGNWEPRARSLLLLLFPSLPMYPAQGEKPNTPPIIIWIRRKKKKTHFSILPIDTMNFLFPLSALSEWAISFLRLLRGSGRRRRCGKTGQKRRESLQRTHTQQRQQQPGAVGSFRSLAQQPRLNGTLLYHFQMDFMSPDSCACVCVSSRRRRRPSLATEHTQCAIPNIGLSLSLAHNGLRIRIGLWQRLSLSPSRRRRRAAMQRRREERAL